MVKWWFLSGTFALWALQELYTAGLIHPFIQRDFYILFLHKCFLSYIHILMNVSESTSGLVSCPSLHAAWSSQSATTNFRLLDDLCYLLNYSHRWRSYNFWFTLEIITCSDNYRLMLRCRMTTAGLFQSETAAIALLHPFSFNACSLVVCLYFDYFIFSFSALFSCVIFFGL